MVHKYGIDISEHNGNINLKKYKDHFIIIRGGYWTKIDKKLKRNIKQCNKLGIPFGIYWYSYALTVAEAKKEAEVCLKAIKDANIKVGVWFDMEDADGYKKRKGFPTNSTITKMCIAFCEEMEKAGYYTGVYASQSWFGTKIGKSMKYPKWIANWGKDNGKLNNNLSGKCVLHQYTSVPLDKDVSYIPLSDFKKKESKKKSITTIAKEVIAGKWGKGTKRKKKLEAAGYDYNLVKKKIKEIKAKNKKKSIKTIAKEVIAGKWGNGEGRKKKLKAAGYDYNKVQKEVNKILK